MKARNSNPAISRLSAVRSLLIAERCQNKIHLLRKTKIAALILPGVLAVSLFISPSSHAALYPTFAVSDATVVEGNPVTVSVTVGNFKDVTSVQFSLAWDPAGLQYSSVGNLGLPPTSTFNPIINSGKLGFLWSPDDTNPVTKPDGTTIFTVTFNATSVGSYPITFGDFPTAKDVYVNYDQNVTDFCTFTLGSVTVNPVPEPVSSALCVFAGLFCGMKLLGWGRKRFLKAGR